MIAQGRGGRSLAPQGTHEFRDGPRTVTVEAKSDEHTEEVKCDR